MRICWDWFGELARLSNTGLVLSSQDLPEEDDEEGEHEEDGDDRSCPDFLAAGECRNVYAGVYTKGPRNGEQCVTKVFNRGSVYEDTFFGNDTRDPKKRETSMVAVDFGWNGTPTSNWANLKEVLPIRPGCLSGCDRRPRLVVAWSIAPYT